MTIRPQDSELEQRQGSSEGATQPVAAIPMGAGYDSAESNPAGSDLAPEPAGDRPRSKEAADDRSASVGLLNDPAYLRNEWQQVQSTFVDDPQKAVHEARSLVDRTLREIEENVSREHISDPTSTEDLRVSFQRYRDFFQRLLSA